LAIFKSYEVSAKIPFLFLSKPAPTYSEKFAAPPRITANLYIIDSIAR
jgi:hypothetical protein